MGQLVALDEGSLGIEPTGEAQAADAAGESTQLVGGRRPDGRCNTLQR
jgi:hypothetical protein